jgi:translation initiation factor IF-1
VLRLKRDGVAATIIFDKSRWNLAALGFCCIAWVLTANSSTSPESSKSTATSVEVEGKIVAVLPGTMFRVQLANGHIVLAHISGKLRKHFIRLAAGDRVKMEMSPYDIDKARITFRVKETSSTGYRPPMRRRH